MLRGIEPYCSEPIGSKWYVRSGTLRLVVQTERGPVDACHRLINKAIEQGKTPRMGAVILCSQRGFSVRSCAFYARTRQMASRAGIPNLLLEWIPK